MPKVYQEYKFIPDKEDPLGLHILFFCPRFPSSFSHTAEVSHSSPPHSLTHQPHSLALSG